MSYVVEMYITKIGVPYEKVAMNGHFAKLFSCLVCSLVVPVMRILCR